MSTTCHVQSHRGRSSRWHGARGAVAGVLLVAVVAACLLILLPMSASTREVAIREIGLVTRDMAFYLEGDTVANPTIRLEAGEDVRFIVRNLDPGMVHNLAIEGWDLKTPYLDAKRSATMRVRAPEQLGTQAYVCLPHREMMGGVIEIVARGQ